VAGEVSFLRKIDANQPEIVKAFRQLGWVVAITSGLGNGFPDLVVSKRSVTAVVEIKDGSQPPSKRELTPKEKHFRDSWPGLYAKVESIADVVAFDRLWNIVQRET
jgi:hypothetical protein